MTRDEHIEIHKDLHTKFDLLIADFIGHTKRLLNETTVLELMQWSYGQTIDPTEEFGFIKTVKDIAKELNLFGIPLDWKEHSMKEFLEFNGYEIVDEDYKDFEYSDCKGYLGVKVQRNE